MRAHVTALGWLYVMWGAVGLLTGTSLALLAAGTAISLQSDRVHPALWLLSAASGLLLAGGAASLTIGRAVIQRRPPSRVAALALAVPTALVVPFGSALSAYAFWVLLHEEARRQFARAGRIR
jgi:hypothetical protein